MREFSVPATVRVADDETLVDAVYAQRRGERVRRRLPPPRRRPAVAGHHGGDSSPPRSPPSPGAWSRRASQAGDRVALLSRTRYEWTLFDYAILAAGAVTVPIYETSSAEQIRWILGDSGAVAVVVESDKHAALVDSVRGELGELANVWRIEHADGEPGAVEQLVALGEGVSEDEVHARRKAMRADDLATLIYTSGTTGRPKGCELTHRNMQSEVRSVADVFPELLTSGGSVLLFLPLAHVFGKVIQCGATQARTVIGHTADVSDLLGDLGAFRPTFLLAVPRVFEKVYNSARQRAHDSGRGKIFDAAADTAIAWSRARDTGGPGAAAAGPPRAVRPARLPQAAGGRRRPGGGRGVGQRPAGRAARALLPRRRACPCWKATGSPRPRRASPSTRWTRSASAPSDGPVPGQSVRIADDGEILRQRPGRVPRLLEERDRHRGGGHRRLVPHRRHRRARRRGLPDDHRAQEGAHRHRRRARTSPPRCWKTGCGRTRSSASAWWSATASRSSARW